MQYPIEVNIAYTERLSRLSTFFRIILSIPHTIVLYFLSIAAGVVLFLSWWAILFTGKYPRSFFSFMAWYTRWMVRFTGYTYLMTDKYPPFSGSPPPQSASEPSTVDAPPQSKPA